MTILKLLDELKQAIKILNAKSRLQDSTVKMGKLSEITVSLIQTICHLSERNQKV